MKRRRPKLAMSPIAAALCQGRRPGAGDFHVTPPRRHLFILSVGDTGATVQAPANPPVWPKPVKEFTEIASRTTSVITSDDAYMGSTSDTLSVQGHRSSLRIPDPTSQGM